MLDLKTLALNLLSEADSSKDKARKAEIANEIGAVIMGWHVAPNDVRRIWRDSTDAPVGMNIGDRLCTICQHPWQNEVNIATDCSFDPVFNYHTNMVDWRLMVLRHVGAA